MAVLRAGGLEHEEASAQAVNAETWEYCGFLCASPTHYAGVAAQRSRAADPTDRA
jgi:hypothetical protein